MRVVRMRATGENLFRASEARGRPWRYKAGGCLHEGTNPVGGVRAVAARKARPARSTPLAWVLQVGAGGRPAGVLQGSGTAVCRVRVVPLRTSTKAGTGSDQGCPGAPLLAGVRAGPWREVTAQTQGAWRFFAFGVGTTT